MSELQVSDAQSAPQSPKRDRTTRSWSHWWFWGLAFVTLVGIVLRFTIRDRFPGLSILFYATPLPILMTGCLALVFRAMRRKLISGAAVWGILLIGLSVVWWKQDWRVTSTPGSFATATQNEPKVLVWNVARRKDLSGVAEFLRQRDPDVIALVEVVGDVQERKQFWREQLPAYNVSALGGMMYLLAKGTSGKTIPYKLGGGSLARQISVRLEEGEYQFLVVDIHASVLRSRQGPLERLARLAAALLNERLVILGDFNTPPQSVWFSDLRKNHRQAFEAAGVGYASTWPFPIPVLQLDQIWTNANVQVLQCCHLSVLESDHRAVEIRIRPSRSAARIELRGVLR